MPKKSVEYAFISMYPEGPILFEDIAALYPGISNQAIYKKINRAIEAGRLARYCQGVYYVPKEDRFGEVRPWPIEVAARKWMSNGEEVFGYLAKTSLDNQVGITSQVPAWLEITTNKESSARREVEAFGGWKKIILYRPRVEVTAENVDALKFLDVITNMRSLDISEYRMGKLKQLASKADKRLIFDCAQAYPAQTAKKLVECEVRNVFA